MKKLLAVVLVLAGFLALLTLFIVPRQGGLISSTSLQADKIQQADQKHEESLPIQEVGMGRSGRSIIIALVMLSHVLFANLHLGGS